ncbi:hypothetical protein JOE62_001389 [Glutamicibacter nicotianae]|nr:hypothetical protein [Glutamicibacter nicotianae]
MKSEMPPFGVSKLMNAVLELPAINLETTDSMEL